MQRDLAAQLAQHILILDGAMGTMIQQHSLSEADFRGARFKEWPVPVKGNNDLLTLTQPALIQGIHAKYLAAGADIIETNTFNSTSVSLHDYQMAELAYELNKKGAELAVAAIKETNCKTPKWVAGVLGPTAKTCSISPDVNDPGFRNISFDELVRAYTEATQGLLDGGADIILIETVFDTLNCKAAIFAVLEEFDRRQIRLPIMISGTITDASGRTLSGQTVEAFYNAIRHAKPVAVGLNCALGPDLLRPYVAELARICEVAVSVHPNAGLPNEFGGYDLGPEEMAEHMASWAEAGLVNIVGGCCGTTPEHITAMKNAVVYSKPRAAVAPSPTLRVCGLEPMVQGGGL